MVVTPTPRATMDATKRKCLTLDAIVTACCDDEPSRYLLTRPVLQDGRTAATNGHILISVEPSIVPSEPVGDGEKFPKLDWFYEEFEQRRDWVRPEAVPVCKSCHGTPKQNKQCPKCLGDGVSECPTCGKDWECPECDNGRILRTCEECSGQSAYVEWLGEHVRPHYAWLITHVDDVEIAAGENMNIYFRAPGVLGVVMGMRKDT